MKKEHEDDKTRAKRNIENEVTCELHATVALCGSRVACDTSLVGCEGGGCVRRMANGVRRGERGMGRGEQ